MNLAAPEAMDTAVADRAPAAARRPSSTKTVSNASEVVVRIEPVAHADRALPAVEAEIEVRERSELAARVVNIIVASVALVLLAPLMALIAVAIRLTSKGPAIYSQTRVGIDRRWQHPGIGHARRQADLGGRPFTMYKFRTMCVDAEANGREVWAAKSDPRVTAIGCLLRKTRLDELPQLWNVLRGDMNIVGPRPERPSIFAELRDGIPNYAQRQKVRPGITGWAQINQSYDTCMSDVERKVALDLEYLREQSLAKDLQIMSKTLPVMVLRKGGW